MSLLKWGKFKSHSGLELDWKIDCDALTDDNIDCLANIIAKKCRFNEVVPIETGGNRLAKALKKYENPKHPTTLIVDDVYTTGASMEAAKVKLMISNRIHKDEAIEGVVIFARKHPAWWVWPIFSTYNSLFDQEIWRSTDENIHTTIGNDQYILSSHYKATT